MKNKVSCIIFILLMLSFMPFIANAAESGACGKNGDNLTWTLDDDGTLTISGTGDMGDYSYDYEIPWSDNRSNIKRAVIEDGVTSIGESGFDGCNNLESIVIPDSINSIGAFAFCDCMKLSDILIGPESTRFVLIDGVLYNKDITELILAPRDISGEYTVPEGVTEIGSAAFNCCYGLSKINFPTSIHLIDEAAFANCVSLKNLYIPLMSVAYNTTGDDENYAGIATIKMSAFYGCTGLETAAILITYNLWGEEDIKIDPLVFYGCTNLKTIYLPRELLLGSDVFRDCVKIQDIFYAGNRQDFEQQNLQADFDQNDELKNAKIHYESVPYTPVNGKNYILDMRYEGNKVCVDLKVGENVIGQQTWFTVRYDENGEILSYVKMILTSYYESLWGGGTLSVDPENAATIKSFVWNNEEYMMPASNSAVINLK